MLLFHSEKKYIYVARVRLSLSQAMSFFDPHTTHLTPRVSLINDVNLFMLHAVVFLSIERGGGESTENDVCYFNTYSILLFFDYQMCHVHSLSLACHVSRTEKRMENLNKLTSHSGENEINVESCIFFILAAFALLARAHLLYRFIIAP